MKHSAAVIGTEKKGLPVLVVGLLPRGAETCPGGHIVTTGPAPGKHRPPEHSS